MAKVISKTTNSKVVVNKNGSTSTFTRSKPGGTLKKTGGSGNSRKKK